MAGVFGMSVAAAALGLPEAAAPYLGMVTADAMTLPIEALETPVPVVVYEALEVAPVGLLPLRVVSPLREVLTVERLSVAFLSKRCYASSCFPLRRSIAPPNKPICSSSSVCM